MATLSNTNAEPSLQFGDESNASLASKMTSESETSESTCQRSAVAPALILPGPLPEERNRQLARPIDELRLREYQWPIDDENEEWYVLEEHLSDFLGVKTLQQKHPDLTRRHVAGEERAHLIKKGIIQSSQDNRGFTSLRSYEVLDLLMKEYPQKYEEFVKIIEDSEQSDASRLFQEYTAMPISIDKGRMSMFFKKAMRSAAEYNSFLTKERKEERRAYYDLQTGIVQLPKHTVKCLPAEQTQVGLYPVAVIHGQHAESYKRYTSDELKYLPLNTATYSLPKVMPNIYADPGHCGDTDDDSSSDSGSMSDSSSSASTSAPTPRPESAKKEAVSSSTNNKSSSRAPAAATTGSNNYCRLCGLAASRDARPSDMLIQCFQCDKIGHPSCFGLTAEMCEVVTTYDWLCMDCKICTKCNDPGDEEKMMFCDRCDRGYHTFCVGLKDIPTGTWECPLCSTPKPNVKRQRK